MDGKDRRTLAGSLTSAALLLASAGRAWAQNTPAPEVAPGWLAGLKRLLTDSHASLFIAAALFVLLLVMLLLGRLYDVMRLRERRAAILEKRIVGALRADPSVAALPLTPSVRIPVRPGKPATVEIAGSVPRTELREIAVSLVSREAARNVAACRVEDRILVDPPWTRRAA